MVKDYLFDIFVWAVILVPVVGLIVAFYRSRRAFLFILGGLLMLAAAPAGFITELNTTGCCGAPDGGTLRDIAGWLVGGGLLLLAVGSLFWARKLGKKGN